MTTRRRAAGARLRIVQVHSQIGNQERLKRVLTRGLGLGRIGSSVVLPDNPYTRGMIAKVSHIVLFEELAAEPHAARAEELPVRVEEHAAKPVERAARPAERVPKPVEHVARPAQHVARPAEQPVRAEKAAVPVSAPPAQPSHEEPPKRKVETVSQTPAPKLEKPEKAKKAAKPEKKAKPARPAKAAAARKKTAEPKVKAKARAAVKPAPKRPAKKAKE